MVIKKVGALSAGKVIGCLYAFLGLIVGGILSLISLAGVAAGAGGKGAAAAPLLLGAAAVIVIPVFYGVMGFIGGVVGAALYNLTVSLVGGIEIEVADEVSEFAR